MHITIIPCCTNSNNDNSKFFSSPNSLKEFNSLVTIPFFTKTHEPPQSFFVLQKALANMKQCL